MPLKEMLVKSVSKPVLAFCVGQLVYEVAVEVEKKVLVSLKRGQSCPASIKVEPMNLLDCMKDDNRLDTMLLRHVAAGVEASRGHQHVSMALDKDNVGGLSVQSSVFVYGDNTAVMACPQVVRGEGLDVTCCLAVKKSSVSTDLPQGWWCINPPLASRKLPHTGIHHRSCLKQLFFCGRSLIFYCFCPFQVVSTIDFPFELEDKTPRCVAAKAISSRHRLWLQRHTESGKRDGWRPRQRLRQCITKRLCGNSG
jgi:hypothetical protein